MITPGNVNQFDYSTGALRFINSWDSSHAYACAVQTVGSSLIVCGHGGNGTTVNSPLNGCAVRFDSTKSEEWNAASYQYGSYYSGAGGVFAGAIDASGVSWLYSGTSSGALSDIQISPLGVVSAGVSGAKGRIWPSRYDTTFATADDSGKLYLRDSSGSILWSKSLPTYIVDAAVTPSGKIWVQRLISSITWSLRLELHDATTNPVSITLGSGASSPSLLPWKRSLVSFSNGSCALSWNGPGGWTRRYPTTGSTPTWSITNQFDRLCIDESDNLFAFTSLAVSTPPFFISYLNNSNGSTLSSTSGYKISFDATCGLYANSGSLWIAGKRRLQ